MLQDETPQPDYQAPSPPSNMPRGPSHAGYQPPPRRPMVGGRRGKSGPALGSSDARLKQNLRLEGFSKYSGVPLFSWYYVPGHYLSDGRRYRGTTAQALLQMACESELGCPRDAVTVDKHGWYWVDYSVSILEDVPTGPWPE